MTPERIDLITTIIVIAVLVFCTISDIRTRKVRNIVTFPAIIAGIVLSFMISPKIALIRMVWLGLFLLFGSLRLMGMGDLKLCMAVIALRGQEEMALMLLFGALLLLLYCLITDTKKTCLVLCDTVMYLAHGVPIRKQSDKKYPFAVFLTLGYLLTYGLKYTNGRYFIA